MAMAGALLDDDLMAVGDDFPDAARGQTNPVFVNLDFPGNALLACSLPVCRTIDFPPS